MTNSSKVRWSFFNCLPENAGKASTISNIRLSTLRQKTDDTKIFSSRRDISPVYSLYIGKKRRKPAQAFCTGSKYAGEWNILGFSGEGVYKYPHGVTYEGEFNSNGLFHGIGTLTYPKGQKIQGIWKNGELTKDSTFIFACGEILDEDNKYCQIPDRRFHTEIQKDFGPAGQEYLTNDQPTKKLPEGCYDVGEGLFDPKIGCIMSFPKESLRNCESTEKIDEDVFDDLQCASDEIKEPDYACETMMMSKSLKYDEEPYEVDGRIFIEIPCSSKVAWIKKNCRKAWDETTGYRPEFYENWTTGRKIEIFLQDEVVTTEDIHPKWFSRTENQRMEGTQTTNFIKFIRRDKMDKSKNSKTAPPRHDNRQKHYDRNRNMGNIYIIN